MDNMINCGACGEENPAVAHNCIESKCLLHLTHWFHEKLEYTGHDLGHYTRKLHKNINKVREYAYAIADDVSSKDRVKLHKEVCSIIGADYSKFKPFESNDIWDLPSKEEALRILWKDIMEHLWTYTTIYVETNKSFETVQGYRERYFPKHPTLKTYGEIFNE